jgi:Flp pilus assembly protein TadD
MFLVTRIQPENLIARRLLAHALYQQQRLFEALQEIDSYHQLYPKDAELLALRGSILVSLGRTDQAESSLEEAIRTNPNLESPYIDLSLIYASRNDIRNAVAVLQQYLKILPPESDKAKFVEQQIRQFTE